MDKISSELRMHVDYRSYLCHTADKIMSKRYSQDMWQQFYSGHLDTDRKYLEMSSVDNSVMSYEQYKRNIKLEELL